MATKQVQVRISEKTKERLKIEAAEKGITLYELLEDKLNKE